MIQKGLESVSEGEMKLFWSHYAKPFWTPFLTIKDRLGHDLS